MIFYYKVNKMEESDAYTFSEKECKNPVFHTENFKTRTLFKRLV